MADCVYCEAPGAKYHSDHECKQRIIRDRDLRIDSLQKKEASLLIKNQKLEHLLKKLSVAAQAELDTAHACAMEGYLVEYGCDACELKVTENLQEVLKDFKSALKAEE
jgi:uncharacterized hydantoinase/oxoprolinase family protein